MKTEELLEKAMSELEGPGLTLNNEHVTAVATLALAVELKRLNDFVEKELHRPSGYGTALLNQLARLV